MTSTVDPLAVGLPRPREEVEAVLAAFLAEKRAVLTGMDAGLDPVWSEVATAVARGSRLRSVLAYWGWRGAARCPEDDAAAVRAVAALELLEGAAGVHDDVVGAVPTRWGRPAAHVVFGDRHTTGGLTGDAGLFGTSTAILVGNLALVWSDEMLGRSGVDPAALTRVGPVWDTLRSGIVSGQYLDLLGAAGGLPGRARCPDVGRTVQASLHLGATLAGAGPEVVEACAAIAAPLGEAVRLRDHVRAVGRGEVDAVQGADHGRCSLDLLEERIARRTADARRAIEGAPLRQEARNALDALAVGLTR